MFGRALFQVHWLLGITAGVVLLIVGVSGALLSFDDAIVARLNPGVVTVNLQNNHRLTFAELVTRVTELAPTKHIANITLYADPHRAPRVTFAPPVKKTSTDKASSNPRRRGEVRYLDPYNGALLGDKQLRGQEFFRTVEQVHRGMIAGPIGRGVVDAATLVLIFMCVSGLYLRWSQSNLRNWRYWFVIDWQLKGRVFLWRVHAVIGTWLLLFYLAIALTGLNLSSYDGYRKGIANTIGAAPVSREQYRLANAEDASPDLNKIWSAFEQQSGGYSVATFSLPQNPMQAVEVRYLSVNAPHERAFNQLILNPVSAEILRRDLYSEKSPANKFIVSIFPLHSGSYFGIVGTILVMLASVAMPLFAIMGWMLYLERRRRKRLAAEFSATTISSNAV